MHKTLLYTLLGGALLISPSVSAQLVDKQQKHTFRLEKVLKNVPIQLKQTTALEALVHKAKAAQTRHAAQAKAEAITPNWSTTLSTQDDFNLFTVIDANNDAVDQGTYKQETWSFNGTKTFLYTNKNKADDWLVSPAFNLKAGQSYIVKINVNHFMANKHKLEIKWGKAATVEGMTETGLAETTVAAYSNQDLQATITPTADGTYYVGLHGTSEAGGYNLYLNSFDITSAGAPSAPSASTISSITPDPTAALKATIKFVVPSTTTDGKPLDNLKGVKITRNDEQIADLTDAVAGEEYTYVDNTVPKAGMQTYAITAYNSDGDGQTATEDRWVGLDVPDSNNRPLLSCSAPNKLTLNWNEFVAKHDGVIFPNDITYNVYSIDVYNGQLVVGDLKGSVKGKTTITTDENTEEGDQKYLYQALNATNASGSSEYLLSTPELVGKAYDLPVREDFDAGEIHHFWSTQQTGNGEQLNPKAGITIVGTDDADGNGVCLQFRTMLNDILTLESGKINITGYTNPTFVFHLKTDATSGKFKPFVENNDGLRIFLDEEPMEGLTTWMTRKYALKDYAGNGWVRLGFTFDDADGSSEQKVYIDDISIDDLKDVDAAVTLENVPAQIEKGQSGMCTVKIRNYGAKAVSSYKVKITVGDKEIINQTMRRKLTSFGTHSYPVDIEPAIIQLGDKLTVRAEVTADNDGVADNNGATADVVLTSPDLIPATDRAVTEAQNTHTLAWKAPAATRTITDSFENETNWATSNIGKWSMIDGDGGICSGLLSKYDVYYGSENTPFAFTVFNPYNYGGYEIVSSWPCTATKSGKKSLAAFYGTKTDAVTGEENVVDADNWLISPELPGKAQEISFWANNFFESGTDSETQEKWAYDYPETFDILYSTTDTDIASFTKIGDTKEQTEGVWKEYKAQLPEGAKYFAIHHNSKATFDDDGIVSPFLFQIDDVTFASLNLKVLKYNIYRDGELLTSTTATTYVDNSATAGNHVYQVTTVYEGDLESIPVTVGAPTGIVPVTTATSSAVQGIYTLDGKKVSHAVKGINIIKMQDGSAKKRVY